MPKNIFSTGVMIVILFGLVGISLGHDDKKGGEKLQNQEAPTTPATDVELPSLNDRLKQLEQSIGKKVRDIHLVDQDGKPISTHSWFDKPLLLNLVYTSCQDICPLITGQIADLAVKAGGSLGGKFKMLSVSYDTDTDTPEKLHAFGKQFTEDFTHWAFATGRKKDIDMLLEDLGVKVRKKEDGTYQHLNFITLLNPGGVIVAHILGEEFEVDGLLEVLTAPGGAGGIDLVPGVY